MHKLEHLLQIDNDAIWHPYTALSSDLPVYHVESANAVRLKLSDGRELIDGMASWWSVIHGYNQPEMNKALEDQMKNMAHVMFGGLTHTPAIELTEQLLAITPEPLSAVFYSDSGSVSVDVAMKMAIQYWNAKGESQKQKFISLRHGYHGDTFGAMSVCDPETGMHSLFKDAMPKQVFVEQPQCRFGEPCLEEHIAPLKQALDEQSKNIAALIMEPVVQGAGGMLFYSAEYVKQARELCDQYNVLLIFDEIATGFARTGKLFACEHANVVPDIMCVGKAMTGGYLSLAATLTRGQHRDPAVQRVGEQVRDHLDGDMGPRGGGAGQGEQDRGDHQFLHHDDDVGHARFQRLARDDVGDDQNAQRHDGDRRHRVEQMLDAFHVDFLMRDADGPARRASRRPGRPSGRKTLGQASRGPARLGPDEPGARRAWGRTTARPGDPAAWRPCGPETMGPETMGPDDHGAGRKRARRPARRQPRSQGRPSDSMIPVHLSIRPSSSCSSASPSMPTAAASAFHFSSDGLDSSWIFAYSASVSFTSSTACSPVVSVVIAFLSAAIRRSP